MTVREHRQHARLNSWAEVHAVGALGARDGQLRNLGRRGACFVVADPVARVGDEVELYVSGTDGPPYPLVGRVGRVDARDGRCEIALEFPPGDREIEERVLGVIELLLRIPDGGMRRYPRVTWRVEVGANLHERRAFIEDLSAGGVLLSVPHALAVGEEIELAVPDTTGAPLLLLRGRVVRISEAVLDGASVHTAGLDFGGLSVEAQRCINELLRAVLELLED